MNREEINKLRKDIELSALLYFLMQLKQIIAIQTGQDSDRYIYEYFEFVRKLEKYTIKLEKC